MAQEIPSCIRGDCKMKQHIKDVCCGVTFMTKILEVMVAVVDVGICCPMLYSLRLENEAA